MTDNKELLVKMVLDAWYKEIKQTDKLLTELSNDELMQEIAPGKNRGIYLLGHLAAVHDKLLHVLVISQPGFPEYEKLFVSNPDKSFAELPSVDELRQSWFSVNTQLQKGFSQMQVNDWFQRHSLVAEADFAKEPHRNKLNVVLARTNHVGYHRGQLILLKK
jgi:hypothetical protein